MAPISVFTAGNGLPASLQAKERLLDLLPRPLDHAKISRRIEAICVGALNEEYDAMSGVSPPGGVLDAEDNDGEEVIVKLGDWLNTDDQLWGEERFAIGPM